MGKSTRNRNISPVSDTLKRISKDKCGRSRPSPAGVFPREQGRWLAGVQGAAMSPLVAGTDAAKSCTDARTSTPRLHAANVRGAIDYASCDAAADPHPRPLSQRERGGDGAGPMASAQLSQYAHRPFVTDSLRRQSPIFADRPSFELMRRSHNVRPQEPSGINNRESGAWPIRYGHPATRIDCVANSRVGSRYVPVGAATAAFASRRRCASA